MNASKVSIEKHYFDADGNPTTLYRLVRSEPDWAASRIKTGEQAIAHRDELLKALKAFDVAAKESGSIIDFAGKALKLLTKARDAIEKAEGATK